MIAIARPPALALLAMATSCSIPVPSAAWEFTDRHTIRLTEPEAAVCEQGGPGQGCRIVSRTEWLQALAKARVEGFVVGRSQSAAEAARQAAMEGFDAGVQASGQCKRGDAI